MVIPLVAGLLMAIHFWRIRKDGGISRPATTLAREAALVPQAAALNAEALAAEKTKPAAAPPAEPLPGTRFRLLAYVRGQTLSGKRDRTEEEVSTWPHLVVREFLMAPAAIIVIWALAVLVNAPLEEKANPAVTPNPAKAPWYFVGLQELLAYFDPWIAGVTIPTLILIGLAAIPYLNVNPAGSGEYAFAKRKFAVSVFTFGILFWFALIFIGMFMRGPSWAWYGPREDWTVPKETVAAQYVVPAPWGGLLTVAYFAAGVIVPWWLFPKFRKTLGPVRFVITMILLLLLIGVPVKIVSRLVFDVRYLLSSPWFNI